MADFIPNIGEAFALGQSIRLRREEEKRRQALFQQQQQMLQQQQEFQNVTLPEARRRASLGDLGMLAAAAPDEARDMIRQQRADEEFAFKRQKSAEELALKKQQHDLRVQEAQKLKFNQVAQQFGRSRGFQTEGELQTALDADPRLRRQLAQEQARAQKALGTSVTFEAGALGPATTSVRSGLQEDIKKSTATMAAVRDVQNIGKIAGGFDELVGLGAQFERGVLNFVDKLPSAIAELTPEQQDKARLLNDLSIAVGRINIKETKENFGSQLVAQELERSKNNFLNAEMGTIQFESALNAMSRQAEIAASVAEELLGEGFTDTGAKGFGAKADKRYRERRDAEATARVEELVTEGRFNESQILDELLREGLITRSEWLEDKAELVE